MLYYIHRKYVTKNQKTILSTNLGNNKTKQNEIIESVQNNILRFKRILNATSIGQRMEHMIIF